MYTLHGHADSISALTIDKVKKTEKRRIIRLWLKRFLDGRVDVKSCLVPELA